MLREPRFPDIDWYCDHCNAFLNSQKGFDDHKYIWKCKECGYKNSISWASIKRDDSVVMQWFLYLLGFLSYVGLWTTIILSISIADPNVNKEKYSLPLLMSFGLYLVVFIIGVLVEVCLRHKELSVVKVIIRNLIEDITAPFLAIKEFIFSLISIIFHILPIKKKDGLNKNITIIASSLIYTLIFVAEIVALCKITGLR